MQGSAETCIRHGVDGLQDIGMLEAEPIGMRMRIRGPWIDRAQPQHLGIPFKGANLRCTGFECADGEIAQATASVQHDLPGRLHQGHFATRIVQRRFARRGQHLDAVDLEGWNTPIGWHQLDQGAGVAGYRYKILAVPEVDGAILEIDRVGIGLLAPLPCVCGQVDQILAAPQIHRSRPGKGTGIALGKQSPGELTGQQRA